jgi:hypothetical protein
MACSSDEHPTPKNILTLGVRETGFLFPISQVREVSLSHLAVSSYTKLHDLVAGRDELDLITYGYQATIRTWGGQILRRQ